MTTTPNLPPLPRHPDTVGGMRWTAMEQTAIVEYALAAYQAGLDAGREEAAKACEARIGTGEPGIDADDCDAEATECAAAIRNLKSDAKGGV